MSQFTSAWLAAHEARTMKTPKQSAMVDGCRRESELHEQIFAECRRRGWYVVHSRMDMPSTNGVGTPDFIIAMDGGRTLWIEAKAKGRKCTPAQLAAEAWLLKLNHSVDAVWSFEEFLKLL
jgi:hypothetical protein